VQQQLDDQLGLGQSVIHTAVDSAVSEIKYWKDLPVANVAAAPGLPAPDNLIPANASSAVEHARRVSESAAALLSSAFEDVRKAISEIERVKLLGNYKSPGSSFLDPRPGNAPEYLDSALKKLLEVKAMMPHV